MWRLTTFYVSSLLLLWATPGKRLVAAFVLHVLRTCMDISPLLVWVFKCIAQYFVCCDAVLSCVGINARSFGIPLDLQIHLLAVLVAT